MVIWLLLKIKDWTTVFGWLQEKLFCPPQALLFCLSNLFISFMTNLENKSAATEMLKGDIETF